PGGIYAPCGIPLRILHTPGHTPGGVCLYLPEQNLLFSGDTIFSYGFGRTDFEGGSIEQLTQSLHMLFALPAETVILPGHGENGIMQTYHSKLRRS
ncbi:MAG: MBL fold metallo-hydrolase, partial [Clostridia bacterium]|nr:MBL fold metallo-hydrolase [Clostridia bacterium]